jgi:hypothetical protein
MKTLELIAAYLLASLFDAERAFFFFKHVNCVSCLSYISALKVQSCHYANKEND